MTDETIRACAAACAEAQAARRVGWESIVVPAGLSRGEWECDTRVSLPTRAEKAALRDAIGRAPTGTEYRTFLRAYLARLWELTPKR